jgi:endonuclease-8
MPEGDVVWYTAHRLHEALAGRVLTRSDFRVPRLATADLSGDVVTATVSRGKHLMTRTKSGLTVHTHLKMDGSWRVRPAAERLRDSHRIRLLLANEEWQAVGYQLGVVELIRTSEEPRITGHLGPDLLGPDWDRDEAVRRLAAEPDRPIGEALLDQRIVAGIGNMWKAEGCWRAQVDPWRRLRDVADDEALAIIDAVRPPMQESVGNGFPKSETLFVYNRAGAACPRCGTKIQARGQGDDNRTTYWCPGCQR